MSIPEYRATFTQTVVQLDVFSAYAICGAGALVGTALLRPALAHDENSAEVLRTSRWGFALGGVGMTQAALLPQPIPFWSVVFLAYAAVGSFVVLAWAVAAMSGRVRSRLPLWLQLVVLLLAVLAVLPMGVPGLTWMGTWGLAVATLLMLTLSWRVVHRPRGLDERLLGIVILLTTSTSALRVAFLFTWDGPYEAHLLYVPPLMVTPYALMYGVLPILFALLLLNVLNARLHARLQHRAMTDPLTGTLSRLALAESASGLMERLRRSGKRLAVVMVDLDHFKAVNDRHGHAGGDAVLRQSANLLQDQLRPEALLARYGGEEFVALVPVDDLPGARRVAERLRTALVEAPWDALVPGLDGQTASLGVTLLEPDEGLELALKRADEALYRAKNGGRNQVQVGLNAA